MKLTKTFLSNIIIIFIALAGSYFVSTLASQGARLSCALVITFVIMFAGLANGFFTGIKYIREKDRERFNKALTKVRTGDELDEDVFDMIKATEFLKNIFRL